MEYFDLSSFLGAGAAVGLLGFLARNWLVLRMESAIERKAQIARASFELKRGACLEALEVIDAHFSQREWTQDGKKLEVLEQPLSIVSARRAYNQLALTCSDPEIVNLFAETLGLRAPDDPPSKTSGDAIVDLRNAMRQELGFGEKLDFDRRKAWIAKLDGAT